MTLQGTECVCVCVCGGCNAHVYLPFSVCWRPVCLCDKRSLRLGEIQRPLLFTVTTEAIWRSKKPNNRFNNCETLITLAQNNNGLLRVCRTAWEVVNSDTDRWSTGLIVPLIDGLWVQNSSWSMNCVFNTPLDRWSAGSGLPLIGGLRVQNSLCSFDRWSEGSKLPLVGDRGWKLLLIGGLRVENSLWSVIWGFGVGSIPEQYFVLGKVGITKRSKIFNKKGNANICLSGFVSLI